MSSCKVRLIRWSVTHFCGAIACTHLGLAHSRAFAFLLGDLCVEQTCTQHFHCLELVLQLRLLILLADDDAGRDVGDANGGVGGIHALSTGSRRAEDIDTQILVFDLEIDLLRFWQHGDCSS